MKRGVCPDQRRSQLHTEAQLCRPSVHMAARDAVCVPHDKAVAHRPANHVVSLKKTPSLDLSLDTWDVTHVC